MRTEIMLESDSGTGRLISLIQPIPSPSHKARSNLLILSHQKKMIKRKQVSNGQLVHTSNGLVLCFRVSNKSYQVVNPFTGNSRNLPKPQLFNPGNAGIFCKEKSVEWKPEFKVVQIMKKNHPQSNVLCVEAYSSVAQGWKGLLTVDTGNLEVPEETPLVLNGVFHWIASGEAKLLVFDDENPVLRIIILPDCKVRQIGSSLTRSYELGEIWYGTNNEKHITLWMLPKCEEHGISVPSGKWILMHTFKSDVLYSEMKLAISTQG